MSGAKKTSVVATGIGQKKRKRRRRRRKTYGSAPFQMQIVEARSLSLSHCSPFDHMVAKSSGMI